LDVTVRTNPLKDIQIDHPPMPRQLELRDVEWKVLTPEKMEEILNSPYNGDVVYYAVTPEGYEKLSLNLQELKRYIIQQQEIIIYYRRVTKTIQERLERDGAKKVADDLS
jgi:hypothetical protein